MKPDQHSLVDLTHAQQTWLNEKLGILTTVVEAGIARFELGISGLFSVALFLGLNADIEASRNGVFEQSSSDYALGRNFKGSVRRSVRGSKLDGSSQPYLRGVSQPRAGSGNYLADKQWQEGSLELEHANSCNRALTTNTWRSEKRDGSVELGMMPK